MEQQYCTELTPEYYDPFDVTAPENNVFAQQFGNHTPSYAQDDGFDPSWFDPQLQQSLIQSPNPQLNVMCGTPPPSAGPLVPGFIHNEMQPILNRPTFSEPQLLHMSNISMPSTASYDQSMCMQPSLQVGMTYPPTPKPYTSPYSATSIPSPPTVDLPPPLIPRRRGPKPKSAKYRTPEEEAESRRRFLDRNKDAAKRCRERKKLSIEGQQKSIKQAQNNVFELTKQRDLLLLEVKNLREIVRSTSVCPCGAPSDLNDMFNSSTATPEDNSMTMMSSRRASWMSLAPGESPALSIASMDFEPRRESI